MNHPPAPPTAALRVVLVDDHALVRSGVRAELLAPPPPRTPDERRTPGDDEAHEDRRPGAVVVLAEAGDVDAAVTAVVTHRPDVVLLDVHLPGGAGGGGVEVLTRCLRAADGRPGPLTTPDGGPVRFLALSVSDAADDVIAVIRAGARGYVTKTIAGPELRAAVRRVAEGDAVFSPRLAGFVLDAFGAAGSPASGPQVAADDEELDRLTAREREVMRLIARGYPYREVGRELFISVKTVETHVSAVLRKLQLSSRHELTRWAAARDLL